MAAVTETDVCVTAVGYIRVSTADQAESGAGLEAQRRAITHTCDLRSWDLVQVFEDAGASGKSLNRPGLVAAMEAVEHGTAEVLVVAKLDRLSRSLIDFANLMERSRRKGWNVVALDLGVDTSTPQGEMLASVMASFAQYERRLIGLRTKEALAVKRSQGVRLGRRPVVPKATVERIVGLRHEGLSFRAIGTRLESESVSTPRYGDRWHANTIRRIFLSADEAQEATGTSRTTNTRP